MSAGAHHLRPAVAVLRRDLLTAWSYRFQLVSQVFSGLGTLAIFYYVSRLVRVGGFSPDQYFAYAAIGIMVFTIVNATLQLPQAGLRQELVAGTFERMLLAPWGSVQAIVSMLLYPMLYALITVVNLVWIGWALFGLDVSWSTAPVSLPVVGLSLIAFAPFGVLLLASVTLYKKTPPGTSYLVMGLSLVAGLYFPVVLLPDWIRWAADVQPLTPAVELLRWSLVGRPLQDPSWLPWAKLVLFAGLSMPLSMLVLRAALRRSRRRGTILEY